jgi:peptidoglycan hydrolase-like protein with peptidoglycan-binding domain
MTRKFALLATVLLTPLAVGRVHAQSSASTTKPAMSHQTAPAKQDTSKTATSSAAAMKHHHAKWTPAEIKEAQEGLAKAGFYKGKATGVFNADTRKALKEYQKKNNLPVTGRLSDDVLNRLKSA